MPEVADGQQTGRAIITKDGIAAIGGAWAGALAWANAALLCLKAGR